MMIPGFALMGGMNEIYINIYSKSESVVPLNLKNTIRIVQETDYPVSDKIEISLYPDKPESFTVCLRIPAWSKVTTVTLNGTSLPPADAGTYKQITRVWNKGDKIEIKMDLRGRLITLAGHLAIVRGPIVLARDTRFQDGYIYESAVISDKEGYVDLKPASLKPENIWMVFNSPLVLGTDLEGEARNARQINFCDFASAGNTWGEDSRYLVWIPVTLNVMKTDYKTY